MAAHDVEGMDSEKVADSNFHNHYIYVRPDEEYGEGSSENLSKAECFYVEGNFREAQKFYACAAKEGNSDVKIGGLRGYIYCTLALNDLEKAKEECSNFMKLFPEALQSKSTWLYVSSCDLREADIDKLKELAQEVYTDQNVITLGDDYRFIMENVFVFYKLNWQDKAMLASKRWLSNFGASLNKCQCMGEMYYRLGRFDKAFEFLQMAAQKGVDRARLWYLHALAAANNNNFEVADSSVKKAEKLNCTLPFMADLASQINSIKAREERGFLYKLKKTLLPWQ